MKIKGETAQSSHCFSNRDPSKSHDYSTTLSMSFTDTKTWTHSVEVGVKAGVEIEVTTPGKILFGGAAARYKFEVSFSYKHGWGEGESITKKIDKTVKPNL